MRIDQERLSKLLENGLIIDDVPKVFDKNVKNRVPENNDPENEALNAGTFFFFFLHFCSSDSLTVSRFDGHNHYLATTAIIVCFGVVVDVNVAVADSNQFFFSNFRFVFHLDPEGESDGGKNCNVPML